MIPKTYFSAPLSKSAKDAEGRIRNILQGERRRPAVVVLALAAAVALLCGSVVAVRARDAAAGETERREEAPAEALSAPQTATELPRYTYRGDDPYLAAVCDWSVKGEEQARYWEAEVTIPAPLIAEVDASDPQDVRVWGNFWGFSYRPVGTTLVCVSGGERPGLLHLRPADGGYEVFNEEMVGDGEAYGKDMRRIFGTVRMLKLDVLDRDEVRGRFLADYVLQNDLPFTQYQDEGWDPVHIPGTPETPESAQTVHLESAMGYAVDYDLREFVHNISYDRFEELRGVGKLQGISIYFERYFGEKAERVIERYAGQMEQPQRSEAELGAYQIPVTHLRDAVTRADVVKDVYVFPQGYGNCFAITARNTYYAEYGDPVVAGGKEALERVLATFRPIEAQGDVLAVFPLAEGELVAADGAPVEVVPASDVGERIVDETLSGGTRVVLYRPAGAARGGETDLRYWAIDRGDTLLRFAREESLYPGEQYGAWSFTNVLGRDGFAIHGPRGAAYDFCDLYYLDESGAPRLLDAAAYPAEELDLDGDGSYEVLWSYHGTEKYLDCLDETGAVRRIQLTDGAATWKGWSLGEPANLSVLQNAVYLHADDNRTRVGELTLYPDRVELVAK